MALLAVLVPVLPLAAAAATAAFGWRAVTAWLGPATAAVVTVVGGGLAVHVMDHQPVTALGDVVRIDALSAFMVIVIGLIALLATSYGVAHQRTELVLGHTTVIGARTYGVLVEVFVAAMLAAVVVDNLGLLWVAVEATTIATALLVGHKRTTRSLEAAWKYVVIGSVGVAFAFLGTVLVYFASRHAVGGTAIDSLNWSTLAASSSHLDPDVMRLAVGLLVLGYGTKAGLAPMHTWLPDAHSQAAAPISALMSGVLLAVALYAVLRYKVIADAVLGPGYLRILLLVGSLLSLAVAATLLVAQRDYKRLLAYSSIEHMGLAALGVAIGSHLAVAGVLLHLLGHGLGKSVAFCSAGEILADQHTTQIQGVRGLLARNPIVGGTFAMALLALLGFPPFSLFASELAIARAGIADGLGWAVAAALLLLLVAFVAVVRHGQQMLLGPPDDLVDPSGGTAPVRPGAVAPLLVGLGVVAVLGVSIWPIERLLNAAAAVVTG